MYDVIEVGAILRAWRAPDCGFRALGEALLRSRIIGSRIRLGTLLEEKGVCVWTFVPGLRYVAAEGAFLRNQGRVLHCGI
jgi:hypothetical protein